MNDTVGLKYQQLIFDVNELYARKFRSRLLAMRDSIASDMKADPENMTGVFSIFLLTLKSEVRQEESLIIGEITRDFYLEPKDSAYTKWRAKIDKGLVQMAEYRTTKEDCRRFVARKPLDKRYKEEKRLVGDMFPQ
ncbi:MAG: hypothetical protein ACPGD8_09560 [Flavobacteriales bacterium]